MTIFLQRGIRCFFLPNVNREKRLQWDFLFSGGTNYLCELLQSRKTHRRRPRWHVRFHLPSISKLIATLSNKLTFQWVSLPIWLQTNPARQPWCVHARLFWLCTSARWMVDLAGREVRHACGLTSGRHVERWHGWMIPPTEGHAL